MSERPKGYENTDARPQHVHLCRQCKVGVASLKAGAQGDVMRMRCHRCGAEWTAGPGGERR